MPKALVTGATGLLGREIFHSFKKAKWDIVGTGLTRSGPGITKLDLLDDSAVEALIEAEKPSVIIHSAAERSPDAVAKDPERAKALNVDATAAIVRLAASCEIPVLYISTDYVFPGVPGQAPYAEDATPRATNLYGQLKLDGEHAVLSGGQQAYTSGSSEHNKPGESLGLTRTRSAGPDAAHSASGVRLATVLRVPVLYGRGGDAESAVNVLVGKTRDAAAGKAVTMDDWARRFPTNTTDIGDTVVRIAGHWVALLALAGTQDLDSKANAASWPPILHFSASDHYTKYEMCQVFADILGLDIANMTPDKEGGGGDGVQRPYDTQLATGELEKLLGGKLATVNFKEWWTKELRGR